MELTIREEFDAPADKVFAAITDVQAAEQWLPNVVRIEKLTEGEYGVGTKWRETRVMFGKEASEVLEVVAFTPGKSIELYIDGSLGSSKRGEYRFTYNFEERDGRTLMILTGAMSGMGCAGAVFGWLFKGMFRKALRKDHAALRRHIESQ